MSVYYKKIIIIVFLLLLNNIIYSQLLWMNPWDCELTVPNCKRIDYKLYYPKYKLLLDIDGSLYYKNKLIYQKSVKPEIFSKSFFELFDGRYIFIAFYNNSFNAPYLVTRKICYIIDYKCPEKIYQVNFNKLFYIYIKKKDIKYMLELEKGRPPFPNIDTSLIIHVEKVLLKKISLRKKKLVLQNLNGDKISCQITEFRNPLFD